MPWCKTLQTTHVWVRCHHYPRLLVNQSIELGLGFGAHASIERLFDWIHTHTQVEAKECDVRSMITV